jgi:hypothetical protein
MLRIAPVDLAEIDLVEVVDLRGRGLDWDFVQAVAGVAGIVLSQAESRRAAELFRALPDAEQARCHTPPYVVRFLVQSNRVAEFSMCWECANAHGMWRGEPAFFTFDAKSAEARALLRCCNDAFQPPTP